jgi:hypothetical protein
MFTVYEHQRKVPERQQVDSERETERTWVRHPLFERDFEIVKGTAILRVWYANTLASQPNASQLLADRLRDLYRIATASAGMDMSCAIDVKAQAELVGADKGDYGSFGQCDRCWSKNCFGRLSGS